MASYFADPRPSVLPSQIKRETASATQVEMDNSYNFRGNLPKWSKDTDVYVWLQLFDLATHMVTNPR